MQRVFIDFETRSAADIGCGVQYYVRHPSTQPLVFAWCVDDGPVQTLTSFDAFPAEIPLDGTFYAHNAEFDREIWRNCLRHWPMPTRWMDTASLCRQWGLPGGLAEAAKICGITQQKDKRGTFLIRTFSRPRKRGSFDVGDGPFFTQPSDRRDDWAAFISYCEQDILVMRELYRKISWDMTPAELQQWEYNATNNRNGLCIDSELVFAAIELIGAEETKAKELLTEITNGQIVSPNQSVAIARYCNMPHISAPAVREALESPDSLPADVAAVLRVRLDVARTSTKKYQKIADRLIGNRVCDNTMHFGTHTGRNTGTGVQLLNQPRGNFESVNDRDRCIDYIKSRDVSRVRDEFGSVMGALSGCLRGAIVPSSGKCFVDADLSGIEARLVLWLAGEVEAVEAFRRGDDLYKHMATRIFGTEYSAVTDFERSIGKRAVLGCGYGMGCRRFRVSTFEQTGIWLNPEISEICDLQTDPRRRWECPAAHQCDAKKAVDAYRSTYYRIPLLWQQLNDAAVLAVTIEKHPEDPLNSLRIQYRQHVGPVSYAMDREWLTCRLPSGRDLRYFGAEVRNGVLHHWLKDSQKGMVKWRFAGTYGGRLTENVIQSTARELLRVASIAARKAGFDVVLTVYDEILAEWPAELAAEGEALMRRIMTQPPQWCLDLPLAASSWSGNRYRK